MGLFDWWKPKPPKPPVPPPVREMHISVWGQGALVAYDVSYAVLIPEPIPTPLEVVPYSDNGSPRLKVVLPADVPYGWGSHLTIDVPGYQRYQQRVAIAPDLDVTLTPIPAGPVIRPGTVTFSGRTFMDGAGAYRPFGASLFWVGSGYRSDRDRLLQNVDFLAKHGATYLRWWGMVPGGFYDPVDPNWPDYDATMRGAIDALAQHGVRSQVTLWAGGVPPGGFVAYADRWGQLLAGREPLIQYAEMANESYSVPGAPDHTTIKAMMQAVRARCGVLVAPSSPVPTGNAAELQSLLGTIGTVATVHPDRAVGLAGWRHVRQTWDCKAYRWPTVNGEPAGPGSSVQSISDPVVLTMARAVGIMNGVADFIFHCGAAITGKAYTHPSGGFRPANVWDVPGIEGMLDMIAKIDTVLPSGCENWTHTSQHDPNTLVGPQAMVCSLSGDLHFNEGHGSNNYGSRGPSGQFLQMPMGILSYTDIWPVRERLEFDVIDPRTATVIAHHVKNPGEKIRLAGSNQGGVAAYILRGRAI